MNKALQRPPPVRYSEKPIEEYRQVIGGKVYGPAMSTLLSQSQAWNLAYLSFDFDSHLHHPDPYFSTNVRRTIQSRLDGSGLDLAGLHQPAELVQSMLDLIAPRFVYLIRRSPILESLPMYLAYGPSWVDLIDQRARLVTTDHYEDPPVEVSLAKAYLAHLQAK
jgi:hypothetical protein